MRALLVSHGTLAEALVESSRRIYDIESPISAMSNDNDFIIFRIFQIVNQIIDCDLFTILGVFFARKYNCYNQE